MDKKIKTLLIGLAAVCAISLAVAFQLNTVNKSLRGQFVFKEQESQKEKQALNQQLSSVLEAKKRLDVEMGDLRVKFDSVSKERDGLKEKFDFVSKERSGLVDKVQDLARQKKELEKEIEGLKKSGGSLSEPSVYVAASSTSSLPGDDAYWGSILKEKASLELQVAHLKKQLSETQLKTQKAIEDGQQLEMQYKTITDLKQDFQRQCVYNEKLAEAISEDLVREKRDKKAIILQAESLRKENFELKSRLMSLGEKRTSLESKLIDVKQEREVLSKRLSELDNILQDRVDQIIQVKDDLKAARQQASDVTMQDSRVVQLQPIVVKASSQERTDDRPTVSSGQVLAVNDENGFVIIDIGQNDGVQVGHMFSVYRNTRKIGTLEVIQCRKEIAAADVKTLAAGTKVRVGDIVS